MTIKEFFENKNKLAIHCDTAAKATKLLEAFGKASYTWASSEEYNGVDTEWERYKGDTTYSNNGHYGSWLDYLKEGWRVLEFDEIELEDTSSKGKKEEKGPQSMKEEKKAIEKTLKKCAEFFGITNFGNSVCAYTYEYGANKITIYTDRPGYWIGYHGNGVTILKAALSSALQRDNVEVAFIELRGSINGSIKIGE